MFVWPIGPGRAGSVDLPERHLGRRALVEAARVDVDAIGIAARDVETLHAADTAEAMPGDAGVEGVFGEIIGVSWKESNLFAQGRGGANKRADKSSEALHPSLLVVRNDVLASS